MMNRRGFLTTILGLALTCSLTACTGVAADRKASTRKVETTDTEVEAPTKKKASDIEDFPEGTTLTLATTSDPYVAIIRNFVKPLLAKHNVKVKVDAFGKAEEANEAVEAGKADASFCLRCSELDPYNGDGLPELSNAGSIFYKPYGVFSHKHDSIRQIQENMTIAIPGDDEGRGRALQLLQQEGLIRLNEPERLDAHTYELAENRMQIQFREADRAQLPALLEEVDYVILDPSDAEGVDVTKAAVLEASDSLTAARYAGIVATTPDMAEDAKVEALVQLLKSEEFFQFLQTTYGQELLPIA